VAAGSGGPDLAGAGDRLPIRSAGVSSGPDRAGHGIIGMRERVSLCGGQLLALARPGGGFVVRARLPLPASRS
jgi:signal transduction histidine kinase